MMVQIGHIKDEPAQEEPVAQVETEAHSYCV